MTQQPMSLYYEMIYTWYLSDDHGGGKIYTSDILGGFRGVPQNLGSFRGGSLV